MVTKSIDQFRVVNKVTIKEFAKLGVTFLKAIPNLHNF